MEYQFQEPFVVDSIKITTQLGLTATPAEQALADMPDTSGRPAPARSGSRIF